MEAVIDYFKNLDLTDVENPEILANVYKEIRGKEIQIVLNKSANMKLEELMSKSSLDQLIGLLTAIGTLLTTKLGSRIIEKNLRLIFRWIYPKKMASENQIIKIWKLLEGIIGNEEVFISHLLDINATHVLRLSFQIFSGVNCEKEKKYKLEKQLRKKGRDICSKYYLLIEKEQDLLLQDKHTIISFLTYLKCVKGRQGIIHQIIKNFRKEDLEDPIKSFFYEGILSLSSEENLKEIYGKIKRDVLELSKDKYGNYFIKTMIKQYYRDDIYYTIIEHLSEFTYNSNIIYNLLLAVIKNDDKEKINELFQFYLKDGNDFFTGLVVNKGELDTKYARIMLSMFELQSTHPITQELNSLFSKYFDKIWIESSIGKKLVIGYLKGSASPLEKDKLVGKLSKQYRRLNRSKLGKELLVTMSRCCNKKNRHIIIEVLKRKS
ncbi:hypothetical protein TCON_0868 [Astathelohania contejeani]|uniref:Nucleolar protein 9 n=1 Tax=Astathelohania contejeani TaxID=164912 RepID=A0ABQ7I0J9_9MICR|nr:hypothetical protein TCON_0868 [Thelohania contejeani]